MNKNRLAKNFDSSSWFRLPALKNFVKAEAKQISRGLRLARGPNVLVIADANYSKKLLKLDFPLTVRVVSENDYANHSNDLDIGHDIPLENKSLGNEKLVYADGSFLPFKEDVFQTVILAHALENNELPHQLLREADRVLSPDGHLIIAGFNPMSLFYLQFKWRFSKRYGGKLYSIYRTKDWLKILGFETVGSAMFQYAPLSVSRKNGVKKTKRLSRMIEAIGDRWFPMFGGAYVLVARKRTIGMRMIPSLNRLPARKRLARVGARKVIKLHKQAKD